MKAMLPEDIQGLLDHQAVSVTVASFRNEMSGLVRDIRSISSPWPWRRLGAIAGGVLLLLTVVGLAQGYGFSHAFERIRLILFPQQISKTAKQNDNWSSGPGEWVFYASDKNSIAYYFKPSSVQTFGDRVAYTARYPIKSIITTTSPEKNAPSYGAYVDDSSVLDCKKSLWWLTEKTTYNKLGEIVSHFTLADPKSLDLSLGQPIKPGSVLSLAEHILCDDQLRTPLSLANTKLSYLTSTTNGDGDVFYGSAKVSSDSFYQIELLFVVKYREDHAIADLFPGQTVVGLPPSYRTSAEPLQLNCTDKKVQSTKLEYFDQENNLAYLAVLTPVQSTDVKEGSIFDLLLNAT
jgi:hypothetical protein